MNDNRKWLIGIGVVAGLCLCAAVVALLVLREAGSRLSQSFSTDPTAVAAVGSRIAEFDVPPGYEQSMAMSFLVYDMVALSPVSDSSYGVIIMMMQFTGPGTADPEEMQQAMQQQAGQSQGASTVVETRQDTIRGQEVVITVSESYSEGFTFRQWVTVFQGNAGPTMLMIQGPVEAWDEQLVTEFIHSIR
jgi:hypothetical protein